MLPANTMMAADINRLEQDKQHLAANSEGPTLPPLALSLLLQCPGKSRVMSTPPPPHPHPISVMLFDLFLLPLKSTNICFVLFGKRFTTTIKITNCCTEAKPPLKGHIFTFKSDDIVLYNRSRAAKEAYKRKVKSHL